MIDVLDLDYGSERGLDLTEVQVQVQLMWLGFDVAAAVVGLTAVPAQLGVVTVVTNAALLCLERSSVEVVVRPGCRRAEATTDVYLRRPVVHQDFRWC